MAGNKQAEQVDMDPEGGVQLETPVDPEVARLATIRALAQKHLQEIDILEEREQIEEQQRVMALENESRRRTSAKESHATSSTNADEKGSKLRTAEDVLNRIRWDPELKLGEYVVGYLDRFGGNKELLVSQWLNEVTDEDWIPQHRIRYFKRRSGQGEEVVWHRYERIDKIFGSAANGAQE